MPGRVMFVQLKTGHDIDQGPAWISVVRFFEERVREDRSSMPTRPRRQDLLRPLRTALPRQRTSRPAWRAHPWRTRGSRHHGTTSPPSGRTASATRRSCCGQALTSTLDACALMPRSLVRAWSGALRPSGSLLLSRSRIRLVGVCAGACRGQGRSSGGALHLDRSGASAHLLGSRTRLGVRMGRDGG